MSMLALAFVLSVSIAPSRAAGPTTPEGDAAAMLDRLKTLVGNWKGSVEWSGARTGSGPIAARYALSGNGTVVVEDLEMDGTVAMTSVYHLDGHDLRMTHYCGAGNQPRLRASEIDPKAGLLRLSFVDITNLKTPESGHVSAAELRLESEQKITLTFTFVAKGQESYERIELTRVADPAPAPARSANVTTTAPVMSATGAFFAVSVGDLKSSARWYSEKLGLKVVMEVPKTEKAAAIVLEGGGLTVELIQHDDAVSLGQVAPQVKDRLFIHGLAKAGVIVTDFDGTLERLKARGVQIRYGPYPARANQRANAIVEDNAGNLIQLFGQ